MMSSGSHESGMLAVFQGVKIRTWVNHHQLLLANLAGRWSCYPSTYPERQRNIVLFETEHSRAGNGHRGPLFSAVRLFKCFICNI